ncbi:MAG TPA: MurR/RpiR family transcriptional regulator [Candidatus Egerieenecus merdigallinarum]|nr:MurR/RpiR family transcriptional regulator [Candidatus Egerieenecus merdigallinarum]
MQDMQDMIERLNHSGRKLSKGHRRIAQYIVEHYDKAVFMTASRLGESVGVSESTVVRFAAVLGYEGYPQLQRALQELVSHRLTAVQRFEMSSEIDPNAVLRTVLKSDMQNIRATVEELDNHAFEEGVKRILNAKEIYVIGLRSAAPLAQFLGYYLNYIFDRVHLVSSAATDVFEEIARISEADVVIGISFPRYSTRTVKAMRFARSCGAQVISITDGPMSPLHEVSDVCLNACTDMASFVDSLAAPMSVINALVVSLGLHRKEELSRHFKQLEAIWAANDVYLGETDEQKT